MLLSEAMLETSCGLRCAAGGGQAPGDRGGPGGGGLMVKVAAGRAGVHSMRHGRASLGSLDRFMVGFTAL